MKDFLDQEITVGDEIVYPNRGGSDLWMNRATVTEVGMTNLKVQRPDGPIKTIQRVDRVVVVTQQLAGLPEPMTMS